MKSEDFFKKSKTSVKSLIWGMATYTSSSILGPLLIFGGLGFLLDQLTKKNPLFLIIGVFIAFISTNFLIYRKVKKLSEDFERYDEEHKKED